MSRRFQTTPVKRWVHLINHESSGSLNLNQPGWFNGKLLDWRHFSKRKVGSRIPFETPIFCLSPFRIQICPRNPGFPYNPTVRTGLLDHQYYEFSGGVWILREGALQNSVSFGAVVSVFSVVKVLHPLEQEILLGGTEIRQSSDWIILTALTKWSETSSVQVGPEPNVIHFGEVTSIYSNGLLKNG